MWNNVLVSNESILIELDELINDIYVIGGLINYGYKMAVMSV